MATAPSLGRGHWDMDLYAWNHLFRSAYAEAREALQSRLGSPAHPVLVKLDADLILYAEDARTSYQIQSEGFTWLKTLCHVPLALALLARQGAQPPWQLAALRHYCTEARHALPALWDEELRHNNQQLLEASLALLHTWPHAPEQGHTRLQDYAHTVEPLLERNLYAAAQDELCCLHRTVTQLRTTVLRQTWQRVLVVVCGSHQARYHELAKRYFQTLFDEREGEGASGERRVLYGEGIAEESQALRLLAGQLLDRELGRWFLHNSLSLQQDVLGKAVESVLKRLFATAGTSPSAVTTGEYGEAGEQ
jgi:hypothetical protein